MESLDKEVLDFESAKKRLNGIVNRTPLVYNHGLSLKYNCEVYLKREDQQIVRSYKIRGAYNMISSLSAAQLEKGIVCASAGNHAQGVAFSCRRLGIKGIIFMPEITPKQKVKQTAMFGDSSIEIVLTGDTFDDCQQEALAYAAAHEMAFIPPFDDRRIVAGQGTVGMEIAEDLPGADLVIVPVGGGGLASGVGHYLKSFNPSISILGVEPEGAPSMKAAFDAGEPVTLPEISRFIDGAAVKRVGALTYVLAKEVLDEVLLVPEGKVCSAILKLYNEDAIVAEPAGAMSVAALDLCKDLLPGKKVVCVISGGNNDIDRMQEIKERSLLYEGLKHYFIVRFPQRPGALKLFVNHVLGPHDDITRFEFIKKTERESGPALVGIELKSSDDYASLVQRMQAHRFDYKELNRDQTLFEYLV
ncbi:threonine ammonia-lyase IlvA [Hufsiella ginkgonis]|uniref:L-threonine dehydratase n=1 Tax=Hufsiella ginkgonis TaxID=2695274 RepID=A0A7K1Y3C8_9SPHI|nr:threonine ammonia-lyase IlvA [Hufsiella ginkgonis]MXV17186.1 threonine ammonia-lyase IlvA [Hufsiella ginkgonis]